jgi:hypothetical protein
MGGVMREIWDLNDLALVAMYYYNLYRHSQKRTGHPSVFLKSFS